MHVLSSRTMLPLISEVVYSMWGFRPGLMYEYGNVRMAVIQLIHNLFLQCKITVVITI